jgi:hypothetical protein
VRSSIAIDHRFVLMDVDEGQSSRGGGGGNQAVSATRHPLDVTGAHPSAVRR